MALFSWLKKKKEPHSFVFICRGPDPSGLTDVIHGFGILGSGMYEAMVQLGFSGKEENVHVYGPEWNKTRYSSWRPTPGENKDLMAKVKKALAEAGFTYNGEDVKTIKFNPETSYAQMGFFMAYLFIEK